MWLLMFCVSSLRCGGLVCSVFPVIPTYILVENVVYGLNLSNIFKSELMGHVRTGHDVIVHNFKQEILTADMSK